MYRWQWSTSPWCQPFTSYWLLLSAYTLVYNIGKCIRIPHKHASSYALAIYSQSLIKAHIKAQSSLIRVMHIITITSLLSTKIVLYCMLTHLGQVNNEKCACHLCYSKYLRTYYLHSINALVLFIQYPHHVSKRSPSNYFQYLQQKCHMVFWDHIKQCLSRSSCSPENFISGRHVEVLFENLPYRSKITLCI